MDQPESHEARWFGTGSSSTLDAAEATAAAVASATAGRPPALVMVFASSTYDLHAVARAADEAVPGDVPVIGCTTSGEIEEGAAGSGRVVAVALGGAGLTVRTSVGHLADGSREAGRSAAQGLVGLGRPNQVLLMLSEGLAGGRAEVVRGAHSVAGAAVQLVGGCAGDDLAMSQTFQLHRGEVLTGAVVGAAIGSEGPIGVGVGHGWRRVGEPIVVTESDGQRIFRLNDEPALDYYLTLVGAAPELFAEESPAMSAIGLTNTFGLPRPGGEEVRAVLGFDFANRSLFCGDVPQGTVIWRMVGDADSVQVGTRTACELALEGLGGATPLGIVAFDCASRRAILGDDGIAAEMGLLAELAPEVPIAGFYTYGEIARVTGSRGVHNATLVLLALG
ncbi:FIST signal transduction protein [Actinotalea sp. K2]|uniref:FIST signal transduction protein n=1 Tax=Actinotalea sp. K2 TaxID=2939438 RepID=UPI0020176734|nr:FIST N-terminal domain-containing protein [Actinotalea sp. K2]MCL3861154.1 FIST C-terminal domain-containing protein [Actinotalea sp. K2]